LELGIDETAVAAIELIHVLDMDEAVRQSLAHLAEVLPELTLQRSISDRSSRAGA
jgi:hypothetical protein